MTEAGYEYRTGIGNDIHRLIEGRNLILGGVQIPCQMGLLGHSDGDVVLHSVIDALLGGAGMGDIGMFFPDSGDTWKDADSRELMLSVKEMLDEKDWQIINVDVIINAEEPKLTPFKAQMKRTVSSTLGIDFNNVNVKAKTAEGLGPVGQGLAIEATAVVLLRKKLKRGL